MSAVKAALEKYTVKEIAKKCDVSEQSVYDWKKGKTKNLKGETLVELAEVSGFNARWIINHKGQKLGLSDDEQLVIKAFALFGTEARKQWLLIAKEKIAEADASKKLAS